MVCVICVFAYCQYSGHSSPFTKKIKIKCSRIQKHGIFTCTKISAITVVSPHTSHQGNYKCSVKSICVQRFLHVDRSDEQWNESTTEKEEIFVGENFRTFPSKTFRMEFNFALWNWPKKGKSRRDDRKACKPGGRKFGMDINFVHFPIIQTLQNWIPYENFFFYSERKICNYACLLYWKFYTFTNKSTLFHEVNFPCSNSTQLHWLKKKKATNT